MTGRAARALDRWLFAPTSPRTLGTCRAAFFAGLLLLFGPVDYAAFGGLPESLMHPISVFRVFRVPVLAPAWLDPLQWAWKASLLLACLGLWTRPATVVALILGAYLLAVPQNVGRVFHDDALLVFVFAILASSRCGDGFSLDAALRRRRGLPDAAPSGEHRWPLVATQVVLSCVFFAAGWAKLRNSGLGFVTSDHMADILVKHQYIHEPWVDWGLFIARHAWLAKGMAASTLLLELAYPLALVSRRARWVVVPGMAAAQIGIRALMGPAFWPFLLCNVFWVPALLDLPRIRGPWGRRG